MGKSYIRDKTNRAREKKRQKKINDERNQDQE